MFYIREDDRPRPISRFMTQVIESVKGPEKRISKSSDREPLNWLPKLKFFANDFFLATVGLLILKNFTKGYLVVPILACFMFGTDLTSFLVLYRSSEGLVDGLRDWGCHSRTSGGRR